MKKLLGIFAFLVFFFLILFSHGCTTLKNSHVPTENLCDFREGYEYIAYDRKQFLDRLSGYNWVLQSRFKDQKDGWFLDGVDGDPNHQIVYINIFVEYKSWYVYGWYDATRTKDGHVWIDTTSWVCDIEGNIIAPKATLGDWAEWKLEPLEN